MAETEFWRDIQGFEGLYQVSSYGRVKSLNYNHTNQERILKQTKNTFGYLLVCLYKEGKGKTFKVHRLVYEKFVGEIPEGMQVNHINEDKTDNRVDNLNLMTCKENINWGTRTERQTEKMTNGITSKQVIQLSLDGVELARFPSTNEVQRQLGFSKGNISNCCNGRYKQVYGFKWRYA